MHFISVVSFSILQNPSLWFLLTRDLNFSGQYLHCIGLWPVRTLMCLVRANLIENDFSQSGHLCFLIKCFLVWSRRDLVLTALKSHSLQGTKIFECLSFLCLFNLSIELHLCSHSSQLKTIFPCIL